MKKIAREVKQVHLMEIFEFYLEDLRLVDYL